LKNHDELILNASRDLIADFMRARRIALGMSQKKLSEISGISVITIVRFEHRGVWINFKQYLILCKYLDLYPFVGTKESNESYSKLMRERWQRSGDSN
jgi:transcriptional regulator with XRE-family HTH domain